MVALGVVVAVASVWLLLGRILDSFLRTACQGMFVMFLIAYMLAVINPGGGDFAKGFWTDLSAGSVTGLIVLFLGEVVRRSDPKEDLSGHQSTSTSVLPSENQGDTVSRAAPKWDDLEKHGFEQLAQLNAMERQQDTNLWASSAIYLAATGVLLVAAATAASKGNDLGILATLGLGALGLVVTITWWITAERAHKYEDQWLHSAEALEKALGIPGDFAVWGGRPAGWSARGANRVLRKCVGLTWVVVVAASLLWLLMRF